MSQVNPHPSNTQFTYDARILHGVRIMYPTPIGYAADTYPSRTMIFLIRIKLDTCI